MALVCGRLVRRWSRPDRGAPLEGDGPCLTVAPFGSEPSVDLVPTVRRRRRWVPGNSHGQHGAGPLNDPEWSAGVRSAILCGLFATSSLMLGVLVVRVRERGELVLGTVMASGAGVFISAVSFELMEEAVEVSDDMGGAAVGFFAGAAVCKLGDLAISAWAIATGRTSTAKPTKPRRRQSCWALFTTGFPNRPCSVSRSCRPATSAPRCCLRCSRQTSGVDRGNVEPPGHGIVVPSRAAAAVVHDHCGARGVVGWDTCFSTGRHL